MENKLTYEQIYKALFSKEIEEFIPDGLSISHPVIDIVDGKLVDCFLLYSTSQDGSKYTVPTARIVIDAEKKQLVDFKSVQEQPFSVYDGTDYFINESVKDEDDVRKTYETEYQKLYMAVRIFAFKKKITSSEKELLVSYIKSLKMTEYIHLQPFLFDLGNSFFQWAKEVLNLL